MIILVLNQNYWLQFVLLLISGFVFGVVYFVYVNMYGGFGEDIGVYWGGYEQEYGYQDFGYIDVVVLVGEINY